MPNNIPQTPYNFVPLHNEVYQATGEAIFNQYRSDLMSGYISLDITAKTPLFTKGEHADFYKIGNRYALPGSSLRGMIRAVFEIVSFGKFMQFEDKFAYKRYANYKNSDVEIGFLDYKSNRYVIKEAVDTFSFAHRSNGSNEFSYTYDNRNTITINAGKMGRQNFQIDNNVTDEEFLISADAIQKYKDDEQRGAQKGMDDLLKEAKKDNNLKKTIGREYNGIPVWYELSGNEVIRFGHCRNYRWAYGSSIGEHIPEQLQNKGIRDLSEKIFGYDTGEGSTAGLLNFTDAFCTKKDVQTLPALLKTLAAPKPTSANLYLEKSGNASGNWEKPNNKIRGYKQYWHKDTGKSNWKYDAECTEIRKNDFDKFRFTDNEKKQFVTKEKTKEGRNGQKSVESYFVKKLADIDGKLATRIINTSLENEKIQIKGVRYLPSDTQFSEARIYFDNLSAEELGALLIAVNLPEGCCHKIGMAKPLGFGSINVESKLYLIDRQKRYDVLIDDEGMFKKGIEEDDDKEWFQKQFEKKLNKQLNLDYWASPRIKEFLAIMQYDDDIVSKEDWHYGTRYMEVSEFKGKGALPNASEVKGTI